MATAHHTCKGHHTGGRLRRCLGLAVLVLLALVTSLAVAGEVTTRPDPIELAPTSFDATPATS